MLHPEILQLFENIRLDRPLDTDIPPPRNQPEMLGAYIESLFLPILVEAKIVVMDPTRTCGWRTLVENLTFQGPTARAKLAQAALANAKNIADSVRDQDSAENTLVAFVSGRQSPTISKRFFAELKDLLRKHLNENYDETAEASGWRLAVVGKVFPQ
ncbi:MAG: hypothetical protein ING65_01560 [Rhodocyclaceae bacterium]|jgi:hypothetical protein|nr:hypothetical protein [Rhodocyclaceae bacterium]